MSQPLSGHRFVRSHYKGNIHKFTPFAARYPASLLLPLIHPPYLQKISIQPGMPRCRATPARQQQMHNQNTPHHGATKAQSKHTTPRRNQSTVKTHPTTAHPNHCQNMTHTPRSNETNVNHAARRNQTDARTKPRRNQTTDKHPTAQPGAGLPYYYYHY